MDDCEALVRFLSHTVLNCGSICYRGLTIAVDVPWEKVTVSEAFRRYTVMTMEEALAKDLFDDLMVNKIEPHLGQERPAFLL